MFSRINRYADHKLSRTLATWLLVFVAVFASSGVHAHAGMVSFDGSQPRDKSSITDVSLIFAPDFGVTYSLWSGQSFGYYTSSVPVEGFVSVLTPAISQLFKSVQTGFDPFDASSGCDAHSNTTGGGGAHAAECAVKCHFAELMSLSPTSWLQRIKFLAIPSRLPIELLRPPKMDLDRDRPLRNLASKIVRSSTCPLGGSPSEPPVAADKLNSSSRGPLGLLRAIGLFNLTELPSA